MREIKYKAWSSFWKRMYVVTSINFRTKYVTGYDIEHPDSAYHNLGEYFDEDVEVIEFTGLKDKNGKEIYEGDILSYPKHKGYYLIKWICNDSDCGFSCERDKPFYNYMLPAVWKKMKIIGNIFQNKDLLNDSKEKEGR